MLSNAYFLAKFRFDTAENEPAKHLQNFANFANPNPLAALRRLASWIRLPEEPAAAGEQQRAGLHRNVDPVLGILIQYYHGNYWDKLRGRA